MTGELTAGQLTLLDRLSESDLAGEFYFTGGSALAAFYLHHRRSLDLDLFATKPFDAKRVVRLLAAVADGPLVTRRAGDRFEFTVPIGGERLRVEFVHYDFTPLAESGIAHGRIRVDSLRDMLANKLSAIIERSEPKDFADLFFLLQRPELSLAQGIEDCEKKFGWPGLRYLLQSAFLRVELLPPWPDTEPPVAHETAAEFFRARARELIVLDDDEPAAR